MRKTVAIVQSSYLPWKGYFDLIRAADLFILLDDVQYTHRDWRNRNRIKTADGLKWLTIPVQVKGRYLQAIQDVWTSTAAWAQLHFKTICHSYARARYFADYREHFEQLYSEMGLGRLSEINHRCLQCVCGIIGITTPLVASSKFKTREGRSERLLDLCLQAEATEYLSGPSARGYLNVELFERAGICVRFADYSDYPSYRQLFPPFEHRVSIVDLIFNEGPCAIEYMRRL